jgi:uncharacterized membrane protein
MSIEDYINYVRVEGINDEHREDLKESYNKFSPIAKSLFDTNFRMIQRASMEQILNDCPQYEACRHASLVKAMTMTRPKYFLTYHQAGNLAVYHEYHIMMQMACLMRWTKPVSQGGLGLDGSYTGLRPKYDVCNIM